MDHTVKAYQDFLRAIPGPDHLLDDLNTGAGAGTGAISFLCYDIHSLRKVNRAYGRRAGDALLAAVAEWTFDCPASLLYRIEGDQFCLVFRDVDIDTVQRVAAAMESRFGRVWKLAVDGRTFDIFVQASIALLENPDCGYGEELLDLLAQALDISKKERQITLFTAESDKLTREHVRLQMELKNCILSDMMGFHLVYQPFADPVTGTWQGLEALCRWEDSLVGPVPPGLFIEEAEEMGLIVQLGEWVLNKALETCKALHLDEIDHFFISVNVSALQINRHNYAHSVMKALEKHRYPADKLALEITESTQFTFNDTTIAAIETLRKNGVMLALDDFGRGYSGFSNLISLPVDILKTDREFIENIENDTYLQYFYYIMSETAHASGMRLIAEGVETMAQLQSVVKNGADLIQGYLFGRPMDCRAIDRLRANFTLPLPKFKGWITGMADFKHWMHSRNAYKITPSLFGLQNKCIGILLDEPDIDNAIDSIMDTVGQHFHVNRVYAFLRDEGQIFSNRYEWCAAGAEAQKQLFQRVDASMDSFYDMLCENEVMVASNISQLPPDLLERLKAGGQPYSVQSMVVMPMKQRGEVFGFVGFDDHVDRDWMPEELIILHNLCLLCLIKLARYWNQ